MAVFNPYGKRKLFPLIRKGKVKGARRVKCVQTGEEFTDAKQASEKTGISYEYVCRSARSDGEKIYHEKSFKYL